MDDGREDSGGGAAAAVPGLALLAQAFPFFLALDRGLRILGCGPALARCVPECRPGLAFAQVFRIRRPALRLDAEALVAQPRTVFLLGAESRPGLLLRCQLLHEAGILVFVGSPWVAESAALAELGLSIADLAPHDAAADYLLFLQTARQSLDDARALAERLAERNAALQAAQRELAGLNEALERRVQERAAELADSERRHRKLVEMLPDAVMVNTGGRIAFVNPAALSLFGADASEALLGTPALDRVPEEWQAFARERIRQVFEQRRNTAPAELQLLRLDGRRVDVESQGCFIHYRGEPSALVVFRDIGERRRHEAALKHQATHDPLTGLPNRALFLDRLGRALHRAERQEAGVAVLFVDLDHFKDVNDRLSHDAGDALLRAIAERLAACVRASDTVARLGGDEFAVIVEDSVGEPLLSPLAERIVRAAAAPVDLGGQEVAVSCSVGIACFPEDSRDGATLLKQADIAMYRAKEAGRDNYQYFTAQMQVRLEQRLDLEQALRRALEREEFVLHFQPQVELATGHIAGLEALVRWQSPERGLVGPDAFIPLAEQCGLILPLGEWVLERACAQNRAWQELGLPAVPVAVNVAAPQLEQGRFDRVVQQALERTGLSPHWLDLELTESLSMQDPEASILFMRRLKELGVCLSIDDFGTGYSNLSYLKRFPIDRLKIDRAFIQGITRNPEDRSIAHMVIRLAHAFGVRVVAEGVETEAQTALLLAERCDLIQGYFFSRPLPAAETAALLAEQPYLNVASLSRRRHRRCLLILDDEEGVLSAMRRQLRGRDVTVLTAADTDSAFELMACHEVAVVLADHHLPGRSGVQFLGRVRQLYPDAVRMLMTADANPRNLSEAINRGEVFRYLAKPWTEVELLGVLEEAFRRHEASVDALSPGPSPASGRGE